MSIDDSVFRDPRIKLLAARMKWSHRETIGALLEVWSVCYDRATYILPTAEIDAVAGADNFSSDMIKVGLACGVDNDCVRIRGAMDRVAYLSQRQSAGKLGGQKSGKTRRNQNEAKPGFASDDAQASANPNTNTNTNTSAPDKVNTEERIPLVLGAVSDPPKRGRKRRPPPSDPTSDERAISIAVLQRLTARNGVRYTGTAKHIRLITTLLRRGITELELRMVIGYCAVKKQWAGSEKMQDYLRPETLFGPENIDTYLDPARAWFESLPPEQHPIAVPIPKPEPTDEAA